MNTYMARDYARTPWGKRAPNSVTLPKTTVYVILRNSTQPLPIRLRQNQPHRRQPIQLAKLRGGGMERYHHLDPLQRAAPVLRSSWHMTRTLLAAVMEAATQMEEVVDNLAQVENEQEPAKEDDSDQSAPTEPCTEPAAEGRQC